MLDFDTCSEEAYVNNLKQGLNSQNKEATDMASCKRQTTRLIRGEAFRFSDPRDLHRCLEGLKEASHDSGLPRRHLILHWSVPCGSEDGAGAVGGRNNQAVDVRAHLRLPVLDLNEAQSGSTCHLVHLFPLHNTVSEQITKLPRRMRFWSVRFLAEEIDRP